MDGFGEETAPTRSWSTELGTSIIGLEKSHGATFPGLANMYGEVLRGAAHVHAYVASVFMGAQECMGRIGAALFPETDPVHVAGVAAVAEGAGLIVSDAQGRRIDWTAKHVESVLIATPRIHDQVLEALSHASG